MPTEILPTHTPDLLARAVERAAELLRRGDVVVVPTETVYGLAANALDPKAVARIFQIKGRPAHNPVIVHVASSRMAHECASVWPAMGTCLAGAFWPGPLTLVVPRSSRIPDIVTAGGNTVGIRWPQHPFMQAVIQQCGFPLAAPSANLSNQVSPTNASHVLRQLRDRIPLLIDGGDCNVGIESTVVDVTGRVPKVLRPGIISEPTLMAAAGVAGTDGMEDVPGRRSSSGQLRSPGLLARHYCPKAQVRILKWIDEPGLVAQLASAGIDPAQAQILAHTHIPLGGRLPNVSIIPHDPEAFARGLYAELHRCDDAGFRWIVVEELPDGAEWAGVTDRLRRAAAS